MTTIDRLAPFVAGVLIVGLIVAGLLYAAFGLAADAWQTLTDVAELGATA